MITSWLEQLGLAKPPAGRDNPAVRASAPETTQETLAVAPKAPAVVSLDPGQVQQIDADIAAMRQAVERHLADVRETVEHLAASQEQMAREITKLQAAGEEILEKIPAPPAHRPAAPTRKPTSVARPSLRAPIPPHLPPGP